MMICKLTWLPALVQLAALTLLGHYLQHFPAMVAWFVALKRVPWVLLAMIGIRRLSSIDG